MENSFFVQPIDMPDICACIMHFYACIMHKMPISEIYAWQKYVHVRNISMLRICACMMHFYACIVQNMCMLEINVCPNIYVLETYLHVRNTCMIEIYIHAGTQPAIF